MSENSNGHGGARKGAGRRPGYSQTPLVRQRISTGMILSRLTKHVRGEIELTATQVRAAEILLKKALPDLASVEHKGTFEHRNVRDLTDAELMAIAAGGLPGADSAEAREDEPRGVHRLLDS